VLAPTFSKNKSCLRIKAPAKINLFLKVLSRRPDGFHEIKSIMQKVTLFDHLHLSRQGRSISLACPGNSVPEGPENLAYQAAMAFFSATGKSAGVQILLEKHIPVAAGLGGGSSDAAAVLLGLNLLLEAELELDRLVEVGLQLGADVPFFVYNYGCAEVAGIGERIEQIVSPVQNFWIVLVNPGLRLSTKWVYENFPLTSSANPYILAPDQNNSVDEESAPARLVEKLGNDLETVSIKRFPEIGNIKKELKLAGAAAALMSGSGPTVFGLFSEKDAAHGSYSLLAEKYGDRVFLVRPYIP
jgi:4-diphosphocytidyl-2-C-methyl-D-erythritol kinase